MQLGGLLRSYSDIWLTSGLALVPGVGQVVRGSCGEAMSGGGYQLEGIMKRTLDRQAIPELVFS